MRVSFADLEAKHETKALVEEGQGQYSLHDERLSTDKQDFAHYRPFSDQVWTDPDVWNPRAR